MKSLRQSIEDFWEGTSDHRSTLFDSARLKLTGFYLAVLLAFSLTITLSVRAMAQREFEHAGVGARSAVQRLLYSLYSVPPRAPTAFNNYQQDQEDAVRRRLNQDAVLINLGALIVGGWLSYWYAGRALKPIEEAHEAQARFASDASHELRTPLANLRLENEVFLRQKHFNESEARDLIESNLEEVQRLEQLANNLLSLTQYEHAALNLRPTSIATIAEGAVAQTAKASKAKAVTIARHVQPRRIFGDGESLTQLLSIVLENAYKYGPEKSTIYITGQAQSDQYVLSVRDEGQGIATADLPHIFERLYRGDKARRNTGGYGLGLSLAREIAAANQATLEAENHPEGGAVFTLTLKAA